MFPRERYLKPLRRAKAKQEDGKQSHQPATPSQPDILPIVPKTFEAEFQYLIEAEQRELCIR